MKTPLGENSYSLLLADKIGLQLMGMLSSGNYCKPWVKLGWGGGGGGEAKRELGGTVRGSEEGQDRGEMAAGVGLPLSPAAAPGLLSLH